ncbi:MAG: YdcF family protein [Gemmatimonadaceae bacterium]
MLIYVHKLLPLLVSPLVVVMTLVGWGTFTRRRWPVALGVGLLFAASTPLVSDRLVEWSEEGMSRGRADGAPLADAIVVLGGMTAASPAPRGRTVEWGDGVDRFLGGLALLRAERAPRLIFTRGQVPWMRAMRPEGEFLSEQARAFGVPGSRLALTRVAANTAEEAAAVRALVDSLGIGRRILLVTSAYHMSRAAHLFSHQGFTVTPFPVDFRQRMRARTPMDFLPDAEALANTDRVLREGLGRGYYRLRAAIGVAG